MWKKTQFWLFKPSLHNIISQTPIQHRTHVLKCKERHPLFIYIRFLTIACFRENWRFRAWDKVKTLKHIILWENASRISVIHLLTICSHKACVVKTVWKGPTVKVTSAPRCVKVCSYSPAAMWSMRDGSTSISLLHGGGVMILFWFILLPELNLLVKQTDVKGG